MRKSIAGTTLVVTGVLYQESQTSLLRCERGETVTLVALEDTATGKTGHFYHEIATDKRDIDEENFWTDNLELFENNHPEAYIAQDLMGLANDATPRTRTDDIDDVIAACCENQLEYREGNPDGKTYDEKAWGLYAS